MMDRQQEEVPSLREPEKTAADERSSAEIETPPDLGAARLRKLRLLLRSRDAAQVYDREVHAKRSGDALYRFLAQHRHRGPQGLVTAQNLVQRMLESGSIEEAGQLYPQRLIVHAALCFEFFEKPQALLCIGQREAGRARCPVFQLSYEEGALFVDGEIIDGSCAHRSIRSVGRGE